MKQENILEKTGIKYVMLCYEPYKTHLHLFNKIDEDNYIIFTEPSLKTILYIDNYFNILNLINKAKEQDNEHRSAIVFEYEIKEENEAREIIKNYVRENNL